MSFTFEIGQVPKGWSREYGVRIINGHFDAGPRAGLRDGRARPFDSYAELDDVAYVVFVREEREKVKAWIDWYMTEYDE